MKKSVKILWRVFLIGIGAVVLLFLLADLGALGSMPSISELENPTASLASQVYAEDGTLMGKYYLEDRVNVGYKDISKYVINALVATEDERFYEHSGVDPRSLGRAISSFGSGGGASTITMQTAKNLFTQNWGTKNGILRILQKIKESIIAIKLERNFTKDEIVTLYLNTVAFGDNVYGIRNAAKTFFQKEPDRLSIEEAAMLVGMLKGGIYNPRRYPKQAMDRRNTVMNQMVRNGYLSSAEADKLKRKPIALNYRKMDETAGIAPYFRMVLGEDMKKWCKEHTKSDGSNYNLYKDGLKIYTTINPIMQQYAEEALAKHYSYMQKILAAQSDIKSGSVWKGHENILEAAMKQSDRWKNAKKDDDASDTEIRKSFFVKIPMRVFAWNNNRGIDTVMTPYDSIKYHRQMLQAGFMAMDPLRGEIKAWVGGIDFKTFKYDHVNINTKRQVGSTMKPLLYSLAIEHNGFTPNTMVEDVQQNFGSYGQVPATTASCSGQTMPMAKALALSRNCATAYIMKQLGPQGNDGAKLFVNFLKECNVQTNVEPYPSIALGSAEISLYEMMQAYSMFPGRGFNVKPMYITRIEDRNGNVVQTFIPQRKEVISDVTAYSIVNMMQGVMKYGTGRRMWSYDVNGEIAGKTGTTNDNSDAWFMGYTPQLIAGVWTGCDDRFIRFSSTSMGQGSSVALPVWAYFYDKASNDKSLAIDTKSTFVKPDVMTNDMIWSEEPNGQAVPSEANDGTNGSASDYGDEVPPNAQPQDLAPESKPPANNGGTSPTGTPNKPVNNNKPGTKPGGTLAPPPQQPKAVLPKKGR